MRLLIAALLASVLVPIAQACVVSGSTTGSFSVQTVECTGTSVIWLMVSQSTPGPMGAGEDLVVQGEVVRLDAEFTSPVVGTVVLRVFNQTQSANVSPDAFGRSMATFYYRVPDVDSGNAPYYVDGYVEKVVCPNSTMSETLKLSSNGTVDVAGCSTLESAALKRKMQGVSDLLLQAERAFYDTLDILGGNVPQAVSKSLLSSMKNFEDAKYYSRQFSYEHDSRNRCAFAKTAADWAQRYAENAYSDAGMAYSLASSGTGASAVGLYEVALFGSVAAAAYLLMGRKRG